MLGKQREIEHDLLLFFKIILKCHTFLCSLINCWKNFLISFACNASNSFVTFLLMFSVPSNLHPFSVDSILGHKKKSGGDKSGEYGG
jgi:hypothetical protein